MGYQVAIDGPAGAGKSTIAKLVAKEKGFIYVDTGAMYRTVGLYAKRNQIEPNDEKSLQKHFSKIDIKLEWIDGSQHVFLNGEDVSDKIRTPEMSMYASAVSALPAVRAFLLEKQRDFARNNNVIMDGRDIGTVVLPDAQVKIFLKAGNEERARRRYEELIAKGQDVKFEDVLDDMLKRDKNDSTRAAAPCVPAHDAVLLDNSGYEPETTERKAMEIINAKLGTKF